MEYMVMATDIYVRIVPGGAMAVNQIEADKFLQFRGKEMKATFTVPRNYEFHKKFMALVGVGYDMADTDLNFEQFRKYCTAGAGYCDFIEHDGELVAVPRSISFAAMDETEFSRLYQDLLKFICQKWVLDEKQLNQIVGFM
jgi:hypothetical protein